MPGSTLSLVHDPNDQGGSPAISQLLIILTFVAGTTGAGDDGQTGSAQDQIASRHWTCSTSTDGSTSASATGPATWALRHILPGSGRTLA